MRLWERIHGDLQDFGRGFCETLGEDSWGFARIHQTLGEDLWGFVRIRETLGEDLPGFVRLWERIHEDS